MAFPVTFVNTKLHAKYRSVMTGTSHASIMYPVMSLKKKKLMVVLTNGTV
jgi:hypothetical protein